MVAAGTTRAPGVAAATEVAVVVGVLGLLPGAVLGIQRVGLVARLFGCDGSADDDAAMEDLLQSPLGYTDSPLRLMVGAAAGAPHRGAVIGNTLVLWVGGGAAAGAVTGAAWVVWWRRAVSPSEAAARLRLPGVLTAALSLVLQQTVASSVTLLQFAGGVGQHGLTSPTPGGDAVLGAVGLLCVCAVGVVLCAILLQPAEAFPAQAVAQRRVLPRGGRWTVSVWLAWWVAETVAWRPRRHATATAESGGGGVRGLMRRVRCAVIVGEPRRFVLHYGSLFVPYRRGLHWWLLAECALTVALGVASGVTPSSAAGCAARAWIAVALCAAWLCVLGWRRPTQVPLETLMTFMIGVAQLIIALCAALNVSSAVLLGLNTACAVALTCLAILLSLSEIVRILSGSVVAIDTDRVSRSIFGCVCGAVKDLAKDDRLERRDELPLVMAPPQSDLKFSLDAASECFHDAMPRFRTSDTEVGEAPKHAPDAVHQVDDLAKLIEAICHRNTTVNGGERVL